MKGSQSCVFDIHYHLLFGLDDGPKTIDESLQLAEASIAEGVTHIVATPHANDRYSFQPEVNRERLAMLQERLGDRLTLGLGCDFHLSYENIEDQARNPSKYTINGKQYLLVELSDFGISQNMSSIFFEMRLQGTVPIITHPERNPTLASEQQRMAQWIAEGCLVQVTAASLSGRFGSNAQAMAMTFVKRNWVHLIASDAHNADRRGPSMRRAYELLKDRFGTETADRLCVENPRAVFLGERMPPQPEPEHMTETDQPARGGFWSRLLGK